MAELDTIIVNPTTGGVHRCTADAFELAHSRADNAWVLASSKEGRDALGKLTEDQLRAVAADVEVETYGIKGKAKLIDALAGAAEQTTTSTAKEA